MRDPSQLPVVRVEFTLVDGTVLTREWTLADLPRVDFKEKLKSPPDWLDSPRKRWDHPQDPITMSGNVLAGHEDEARQLLGLPEGPQE